MEGQENHQRTQKRRTTDPCPTDALCMEHSGLKSTLHMVLLGVMVNVGLLSWNVFVTSSNLQQSLALLRGDINQVIKANEKLEVRVSALERLVFYKPTGVKP